MCGAPRAGFGSSTMFLLHHAANPEPWWNIAFPLLCVLESRTKKQIAERPVGRCASNVTLQTLACLVQCCSWEALPSQYGNSLLCVPLIHARDSLPSSSSICPMYPEDVLNWAFLQIVRNLFVLNEHSFLARIRMSAMLYHNTVWLDLQCW